MASTYMDVDEADRYVFLHQMHGLFRFQIPTHFDDKVAVAEAHKLDPKYELELLCNGMGRGMPNLSTVGMFSKGYDVYLVGGNYWDDPAFFNQQKVFIFDPLQVASITSLPAYSKDYKEPLVMPFVFRATTHVYFLTLFDHPTLDDGIFTFQSYDLMKGCFYPLKPPPISVSFSEDTTVLVGHFLLLDYLYLFIKQAKGLTSWSKKSKWRLHAFSSKIKPSSSVKWKKLDSEFNKNHAPIPYGHNGDTGLSIEFPDNIRILVALHSSKPTAYRVSLDKAGGSLQLKSHRLLLDHLSKLYKMQSDLNSMSHLLDIGGDRFCVVYSSRSTPLLVYIFKMNFRVEYENGNSVSDPNCSDPIRKVPNCSVEILSSKKFEHNIDVFMDFRPSSVCLASAPRSSHRYLPSREDVEVNDSKQPKQLPNRPRKTQGVAYLEDVDEMEDLQTAMSQIDGF